MAKRSDHEISPIGQRLRELRKENDWTLAAVSKSTGISVGTLSKVENGHTDLNFTSVNKLAQGLNLPVTELTNPQPSTAGLRTVTSADEGVVFHTEDADYEVLCSDVANQQQCHMKATVRCREFDPTRNWHRHNGQEFIYVLKGHLELHTELYAPVHLKAGDSMLFDSSMGHQYVSRGRTNAQLLVSFSLKGYEDVSDVILAQSTT